MEYIILWILVSLITGALAARKGYSFILWMLAAGIIGLLILAFLPYANTTEMSPEEQKDKQQTGNIIGGVLAVVGAAGVALRFL